MATESSCCIRCGRCLSVCPLFQATGLEEHAPRAKAMLLESLDAPGGPVAAVPAERLASLCLGCHRCVEVCPQGVNAPAAVSELRAAHPDFLTWLWKTALRHPQASMALARLAPQSFAPRRLDAAPPSAPAEGPWVEVLQTPTCFQGRKAVFFPGCASAHLVPRWAGKAERLLMALGLDLAPADFGCCGLPQESAGLLPEAGASRRRIVEQWRAAGEPLVVAVCATCRQGLAQAAWMLGGEEGRRLEQAVTPLASLLDGAEVRVLQTAPERVALHRPCHETGPADERFLRRVLGERLALPASSECCGFGGALRAARVDLAERVGVRCWDFLLETGASAALTGCTACAMALAAQAPPGARAFHWLDILS
jgi:glycolate oxidase iron-sulfur subunit